MHVPTLTTDGPRSATSGHDSTGQILSMRLRRRLVALVLVGALAGSAHVSAGTSERPPILRPGPGQIALLEAPPGLQVRVLGDDEEVVAEGDVDFAGSVLFRHFPPGTYTVEQLTRRLRRRPR